MEVLVTNDDGYGSPGLAAVAGALRESASVTVLAPAQDQSAVGRRRSEQVRLEERDDGYVVDGTPADCVIVGLEALDLSPDLVVAGCNIGANLGAYVLGRSGTISAAVEAAFFDVPAIALSLYVPESRWPLAATKEDFREAVRSVTHLASPVARGDALPTAGYLNVNVPLPGDSPAKMAVTRPSNRHALTAQRQGGHVEITDETWTQMANGRWTEGIETDRGAVMQGRISVSPLSAPHQVGATETLQSVVEAYPSTE